MSQKAFQELLGDLVSDVFALSLDFQRTKQNASALLVSRMRQ